LLFLLLFLLLLLLLPLALPLALQQSVRIIRSAPHMDRHKVPVRQLKELSQSVALALAGRRCSASSRAVALVDTARCKNMPAASTMDFLHTRPRGCGCSFGCAGLSIG
jgi:hypothetical protein